MLELNCTSFTVCASSNAYRTDRSCKRIKDAVDLVGKSFEERATLIVILVECLNDDFFFQLKTRIAGELIQKFVQYRRRLAIVGDISRHLAESSALRAFVIESNRGKDVWFLASLEELNHRLARAV